MSKERLEEIQKEVNYAYRRDGSISTKAVTMPIEHYEHLYEQAERVQELEKESERYQRHLFEARNDVASQSRKLRKAKVQNKCYRERLEYMLTEAKDHKEKGLKIQHWALIKDLEETLERESDDPNVDL